MNYYSFKKNDGQKWVSSPFVRAFFDLSAYISEFRFHPWICASCNLRPSFHKRLTAQLIWIFFLGSENPTLKAIYEKTNKTIKSRTRAFTLIHLSLSVPSVMVPNLIISFIIYFTTDAGSESFRMPFPIWWVIFRIISSLFIQFHGLKRLLKIRFSVPLKVTF